MTITFRPLLADLLHAARAWEANHWRIANRIVAAALVACGSFLVFVGSSWGILFLTVGGLEWFTLLPASAIRALIEFRSNPKFREEYQLTLTPESLHFVTATIDAHLKWNHYTGWLETRKVLILVHGARMYTVIPKRALGGEGQLGELRTLLRRVLPRQEPA